MTTDSQDTRSRNGDAVRRHARRLQAFSGLGRVLKDVLWVPELTGWLRRLAGGH